MSARDAAAVSADTDTLFKAPLAEADPEIAEAIQLELGRQREEIELRLRATDLQMAEVAMQQLPVRLAKVLLRMTYVEALGRPAAGVHVSQRELGNIVGASRESVNKCLSQWQRSGWVRIEGTSIIISDRTTLEHVAKQG